MVSIRGKIMACLITITRIRSHPIVSNSHNLVVNRARQFFSNRNRLKHFVEDRNSSRSILITAIQEQDEIRFVAICYDVIQSDAMVTMVPPMVKNFWQPKIFPWLAILSRLTSRCDTI